jgi:hypothetical protein
MKLLSQATLLATIAQGTIAFAPARFVPHAPVQHQHASFRSSQNSSVKLNDAILGDQCLLTPEGYGFSSTAERIIEMSRKGETSGFVAVNANTRVIDVMGQITEGNEDVALVYDGSDLLGIFTESDYIRVSYKHAAFFGL